jgi:hypothetical protein
MAIEKDSQDMPVECMFDITKPSGQVEFLGFIDGLVGSGNNLSGLFEWTCGKCGTSNHDAAIIEPNQSFLGEWACNHCDEAMLVRFRARPIADWIAQHALAITGRALCGLAEKEETPDPEDRPQTQPARHSQKTFAWIAVPLLAILIVVAAMDMRHIQTSSAYSRLVPGRPSAPSYSWLGGYWVSVSPYDAIYFGYMSPAAHRGTYTRRTHDGEPAQIVQFEIVCEETTDDKLVLRELDEQPQADGPQAILRIDRSKGSMVRITTSQDQSIVTTNYYHAARPSEP